MLFLQSSELGRDTLAGEKGGGGVPIPTRGHTLWYSVILYMYVLCVLGESLFSTLCIAVSNEHAAGDICTVGCRK